MALLSFIRNLDKANKVAGGYQRIIDAGIQRWLWAHSDISTVGLFRIVDAGIRRWLRAHSGISTLLPRWAHSGISTLLLRWAHSGLSTLLLGGDCGPIHECRYLCFGGSIQDYRRRYSALAMGPFRYIDITASVGPFRIIDGIRWWLWARS